MPQPQDQHRPERKPFHESIVDAIKDRQVNLHMLAGLIHSTKIPANHDAITEAWARLTGGEFLGVLYEISEQKKEAQKEAEAKAQKEIAAKPKITVKRLEVYLHTSRSSRTNIFRVEVHTDETSWSEAIPTEENVRWFLRGLEVFSSVAGIGYLRLPEIPSEIDGALVLKNYSNEVHDG